MVTSPLLVGMSVLTPLTEIMLNLPVKVAALDAVHGAAEALVTMFLLRLTFRTWVAWVNVIAVSGPCALRMIEHLNAGIVMWQNTPLASFSKVAEPDALVPATEEVEVIVILPGHETTMGRIVPPPRLAVQSVVAFLEKVSLPEILVPVLSITPVNSAVGHLRMFPASFTSWVSVEVAEITPFLGVNVA